MAWDTEWAAERASESMRYLDANYPECSGTPELHTYHDASHAAALAYDRERYLEALRGYMKAGRRVALEARGRAA